MWLNSVELFMAYIQKKRRLMVANNAHDEYIDSVQKVQMKYANIVPMHARGWVWRVD